MFWLTQRTTELQYVSHVPRRGRRFPANIPDTNECIADDILDPHPQRRHPDVVHDVFEHKYDDTTGHAAGKGREPQEEHNAGLPGDAAVVAEGLAAEALLLDRVDDEHAQGGEDKGQPVDEFDVDVRSVARGPNGRVQHDVEGDGELEQNRGQQKPSCRKPQASMCH